MEELRRLDNIPPNRSTTDSSLFPPESHLQFSPTMSAIDMPIGKPLTVSPYTSYDTFVKQASQSQNFGDSARQPSAQQAELSSVCFVPSTRTSASMPGGVFAAPTGSLRGRCSTGAYSKFGAVPIGPSLQRSAYDTATSVGRGSLVPHSTSPTPSLTEPAPTNKCHSSETAGTTDDSAIGRALPPAQVRISIDECEGGCSLRVSMDTDPNTHSFNSCASNQLMATVFEASPVPFDSPHAFAPLEHIALLQVTEEPTPVMKSSDSNLAERFARLWSATAYSEEAAGWHHQSSCAAVQPPLAPMCEYDAHGAAPDQGAAVGGAVLAVSVDRLSEQQDAVPDTLVPVRGAAPALFLSRGSTDFVGEPLLDMERSSWQTWTMVGADPSSLRSSATAAERQSAVSHVSTCWHGELPSHLNSPRVSSSSHVSQAAFMQLSPSLGAQGPLMLATQQSVHHFALSQRPSEGGVSAVGAGQDRETRVALSTESDPGGDAQVMSAAGATDGVESAATEDVFEDAPSRAMVLDLRSDGGQAKPRNPSSSTA
jgi:hypothetical protein